MLLRRIIFLSFAILFHTYISMGQVTNMRKEVSFLADSIGCRYPGSDGDLAARAHLRQQFAKYGLDVKEQQFEIVESMWGEGSLKLETKDGIDCFKHGIDFVVNGRSAVDSVSAPYIVLLDTLPDSLYSLMQGKIVMCPFRGKDGGRMPSLAEITESGALAVVFIQPPGRNVTPSIVKGGRVQGMRELPQLSINYCEVSKFLPNNPEDLSGNLFVSPYSSRITIKTRHYDKRLMAANIIGLKHGTGNRYIVVGAHYDTPKTDSDNGSPIRGANDNASGVALLSALAERLALVATEHSILFAAFGGEEKGSLGSRHLVQYLLPDIQVIDEMINLDMVGLLKDDVLYFRQFNGPRILPDTISYGEMTLKEGPDGMSDHHDFVQAGIPTSVFNTGLDDQVIHTKDDTSDRLNYDGMNRILEFLVMYMTSLDKATSSLLLD